MGQLIIGDAHGTSPVWQMHEAWDVAISAAIALGDCDRACALAELYDDVVALRVSDRRRRNHG